MSKRSKIGPEVFSCESCRTKKLKCSRVHPCSNCTSRGITCGFLTSPEKRQTTVHRDADEGITSLLRRVERLENALLRDGTTPALRINDELQHSTLDGPAATNSGTGKTARDDDLDTLENLAPGHNTALTFDSPRYEIKTTYEILGSVSSHASFSPIALPPYRAAVSLLDSFEANVEPVCPVIHRESIRSMTKTVYLALAQRQPLVPSQAALLLALFSLSAFFYRHHNSPQVASTDNECARLSGYWGHCALQAINHSHQAAAGTLEDLQAHILMSYVSFHVEGFSAIRHRQINMAVFLTRSLRLHRLDSEPHGEPLKPLNVSQLIELETKRRAFWHVAATEWLESTMSGPQEGMYFIHPSHVHVNLPGDFTGSTHEPGSQSDLAGPPNTSTFLLAKIQLAHLCRETTDLIPLETCKVMQMPYEHVIDLDGKFRTYVADLPFFFRADEASRAQSKPLEMVYPGITTMRYWIQTATHSRRCRLHQRFLLRLSSDPRYVYSRQACLESARVVIGAFAEPQGADDSPSLARARMEMVVHHTHLAVVVLVMDLCSNKAEAARDRIGNEVAAALGTLHDATAVSEHAARSLESLKQMLHKHSVFVPTVVHIGGTARRQTSLEQTLVLQASTNSSDATATVQHQSFDPYTNYNDVSDMDFSTSDWDELFASLDSRPL
ncbi:uncharacterized protein LTR77_010088 [Saxophila tyrrhenica]|uniref:Zn(2)-C6 fungal-type domain-containing protein n=1 Tax=Saxophila tyrrhenica TaxID=1690608 RepID=A0AAV9P097_9PEZI|nr:hypothetical protein LTR77_010088 [Saxophila tyrrhenica]